LDPRILIEASNFPVCPKDDDNHNNLKSWTYDKIYIQEDAFHNLYFQYVELEDSAKRVQNESRTRLCQILTTDNRKANLTSWESSFASAVQKIVNNASCVAAIQGTL